MYALNIIFALILHFSKCCNQKEGIKNIQNKNKINGACWSGKQHAFINILNKRKNP